MRIPLWLGFAALALVFWGITGITQKLSTNRISSERSLLWFAWAMVTISAIIAAAAHVQLHIRVSVMILAISGGALNGLGAFTSFRALESGGKASIVISLISLYPLLTVVLAVLFLRERLTGMQAAGAVVAIIAAILLSLEPPQTAGERVASKHDEHKSR
jgi:transporter family protein